MRYIVHVPASEAVTHSETENETGTRMARLLRRDIPSAIVQVDTPATEQVLVITFRDAASVRGDIDQVHVLELTPRRREQFEALRARKRAARSSDADSAIDQDAWYELLRPEITAAAWFAYVRPKRPDAQIPQDGDAVSLDRAWEDIRDETSELHVLVYTRSVAS